MLSRRSIPEIDPHQRPPVQPHVETLEIIKFLQFIASFIDVVPSSQSCKRPRLFGRRRRRNFWLRANVIFVGPKDDFSRHRNGNEDRPSLKYAIRTYSSLRAG